VTPKRLKSGGSGTPNLRCRGCAWNEGKISEGEKGSQASDRHSASQVQKPRYSEKERSEKLSEIRQLAQEGESVKNAVKKVGISEPTYYQWKKSVEAERPTGNLVELAELEAENARLKRLLAEKLRVENAELKKKLGLLN
jgi:DNA invertase Pin-like site-specific DNA recombinase